MPGYIREGEGKIEGELTEEQKEHLQHIQKKKELDSAVEVWDPERDAHGRAHESHKTVICFNSNCPDYRIERTDGRPCQCRRTAIQGAGTNV